MKKNKVMGWSGKDRRIVEKWVAPPEPDPMPRKETLNAGAPPDGSLAWQFMEWFKSYGLLVLYHGGYGAVDRILFASRDPKDPNMWALDLDHQGFDTEDVCILLSRTKRMTLEDLPGGLLDSRGNPLVMSPGENKDGTCGYCRQEHEHVPYRFDWDPSSEDCPFEPASGPPGKGIDILKETLKRKVEFSFGDGTDFDIGSGTTSGDTWKRNDEAEL